MRRMQFACIPLLLLSGGVFAGTLDAGTGQHFANDHLVPVELLRSAAEQGKRNGQDTAKDVGKESTSMGNTAQPDFVAGQARLGNLSVQGLGMPVDFNVTYQGLVNAAQEGNAQSQLNLAMRYENGNGVAKDMSMAMALYEKAALQGLLDAQRILGILYVSGADGSKKETTGLLWLRKAAAQGDEFAKTLANLHSQKFEARTTEAVRSCHQKSISTLDDGIASTAILAAAVQARCVAEIDAWIHAHFPELASQALQHLREGAYQAERSDVAASLVQFRTAIRHAPKSQKFLVTEDGQPGTEK